MQLGDMETERRILGQDLSRPGGRGTPLYLSGQNTYPIIAPLRWVDISFSHDQSPTMDL